MPRHSPDKGEALRVVKVGMCLHALHRYLYESLRSSPAALDLLDALEVFCDCCTCENTAIYRTGATLACENTAIYRTGATWACENTAIYRTGATLACEKAAIYRTGATLACENTAIYRTGATLACENIAIYRTRAILALKMAAPTCPAAA